MTIGVALVDCKVQGAFVGGWEPNTKIDRLKKGVPLLFEDSLLVTLVYKSTSHFIFQLESYKFLLEIS